MIRKRKIEKNYNHIDNIVGEIMYTVYIESCWWLFYETKNYYLYLMEFIRKHIFKGDYWEKGMMMVEHWERKKAQKFCNNGRYWAVRNWN